MKDVFCAYCANLGIKRDGTVYCKITKAEVNPMETCPEAEYYDKGENENEISANRETAHKER